MLIWFLALSFLVVALVFDSPALDYRVVMLGSVVPLVELPVGGPWALHTLLAPLVVLVVVMAATRGRRLARRRWLGLPIGLFMYLVLDGAWLRTELFWWPALGVVVDAGDLPRLKPVAVLITLELIGLVAGVWAVRRYGLSDRQGWRLFYTQGRLGRARMRTGGLRR